MRVDRLTVVFERPGSYVLPGLEFAWWDPAREKLERRGIDPLAVLPWWPVGPLLLRAIRWLIRELRPRRLVRLNP